MVLVVLNYEVNISELFLVPASLFFLTFTVFRIHGLKYIAEAQNNSTKLILGLIGSCLKSTSSMLLYQGLS